MNNQILPIIKQSRGQVNTWSGGELFGRKDTLSKLSSCFSNYPTPRNQLKIAMICLRLSRKLLSNIWLSIHWLVGRSLTNLLISQRWSSFALDLIKTTSSTCISSNITWTPSGLTYKRIQIECSVRKRGPHMHVKCINTWGAREGCWRMWTMSGDPDGNRWIPDQEGERRSSEQVAPIQPFLPDHSLGFCT